MNNKLWELAKLFFRLGVIGFGGPAVHIALWEAATFTHIKEYNRSLARSGHDTKSRWVFALFNKKRLSINDSLFLVSTWKKVDQSLLLQHDLLCMLGFICYHFNEINARLKPCKINL